MYVTTIIVYRRRDKMSKKVEFHGSDLEKIEEYYGILRHRTTQFSCQYFSTISAASPAFWGNFACNFITAFSFVALYS